MVGTKGVEILSIQPKQTVSAQQFLRLPPEVIPSVKWWITYLPTPPRLALLSAIINYQLGALLGPWVWPCLQRQHE
jgi:hypothetical protein